jgi:ribosomal protein L37AE/L43A
MKTQTRRTARPTEKVPKGWEKYDGEYAVIRCVKCDARAVKMVGWRTIPKGEDTGKGRIGANELWQCKKCGLQFAMRIFVLMAERQLNKPATERPVMMSRFF